MTHVYLNRIELAEFRTFQKLDVALAPEPGVLIVHGSNGLGKSSLFDALEWALSGDIDHFTSADGYEKFGNYLCRWGEGLGPTCSALTFSDGEKIERQLAGSKAKVSTVTGVSDVIGYLRSPEWGQPISALNRYLLLTHFLGQSSLSRLTHRKPGERFEILKEVSQSAALQKFGLALHGPGTTLPAKAFTKRIAQLQRDASDIAESLEQEAELWAGAQASGALDDGSAAALSARIVTALNSASTRLIGAPTSVWESLPEPNDLQLAIDQATDQARQQELVISEGRRLLALRDRHRKISAETSSALEEAKRALASAEAASEAAKLVVERRQAALAAALDPLVAAREFHAATVALNEAAVSRGVAIADRESAQSDLAAARSALNEAEQSVQRVERRAQFEARVRTELNLADQRLSLTRASIDLGTQWLERGDLIAQIEADLRELQDRNPDVVDKVAIASSNLATAQSAEAEAREGLRLVEASVGTLSAAVSAVASHLPFGTHDCPVCTTYFQSPQELSARVQAAAARLAPLVLAQQRALGASEALVAIATTNFSQARDVALAITNLGNKRDSELKINARLLVELGLPPDSEVASIELWRMRRQDEASRLETAVRVRGRALRRLSDDGLAASRASEAMRQRDGARLIESAAIRHVDDCSLAERAAEERFAALAEQVLPAVTPTKAQIEASTDAGSSALAAAQKAYDDAATALTEEDLRLAPLQQSEANLRARVAQSSIDDDSTRNLLADLSAQWRAAGWGAVDMDESSIEKAASDLNQASQFLAEADALLKRLRDGRDAWSRQLAHRTAFDRLRTLVDLAPNSTRDQIRATAEQKLAATEAEVAATVQSRDIASRASSLIAEAVTEFNANYIEPLDQLTKRINQAILCDPRIGIELTVQKRAIKQSASVAGEMPNDLDKVDPMLVHSEGQMAALTVSMLCAASLTYPWSRWRALILDDPLQHNDAIHAAAFADLMGNLVKAKEYQVLLTTHDMGQAEFLQRKFGASGIPCAVLNLLGRGKNGVDWTFQPSSAEPGKSAAALA